MSAMVEILLLQKLLCVRVHDAAARSSLMHVANDKLLFRPNLLGQLKFVCFSRQEAKNRKGQAEASAGHARIAIWVCLQLEDVQ